MDFVKNRTKKMSAPCDRQTFFIEKIENYFSER